MQRHPLFPSHLAHRRSLALPNSHYHNVEIANPIRRMEPKRLKRLVMTSKCSYQVTHDSADANKLRSSCTCGRRAPSWPPPNRRTSRTNSWRRMVWRWTCCRRYCRESRGRPTWRIARRGHPWMSSWILVGRPVGGRGGLSGGGGCRDFLLKMWAMVVMMERPCWQTRRNWSWALIPPGYVCIHFDCRQLKQGLISSSKHIQGLSGSGR